MGLIDHLGKGPVAIDTALFIYFIEEHPLYLPAVESLFTVVAKGRLAAVTSAITLLEVLVVPSRIGDMDLAQRYEALLTRSRGLTVVDLTRHQLRTAAQLRGARPHMRTPDALQLAAALSARCKALVTNDRRISPLPGLSVLQLNDYVKGQ
jgi:predicted nucleic acid-binding protein